jgi:hypothetical protein
MILGQEFVLKLARREWEAQPTALCDADELARIGIFR